MVQIVEKIKKLFTSTGKLVFALFLAGVCLFAVVEGYSAAVKFLSHKSIEKYAVAKSWADDLSIIGLKAEGKRKYVGGALVVTMKLTGSPAFLRNPALKKKNINESKGFVIRFKDADEFVVVTAEIPLASLTTIVGDDRNLIGLSGQHREFMDVEEYTRISKVDVTWNIDPEIPKPIVQRPRATPSSDVSTVGDHCAPGINRATRLKRLAQHGNVRITGDDTYKAGGRTVMFGYGGGVIYCD